MLRTRTSLALEEPRDLPVAHDLRIRALERLYTRRDVVDNLIRYLEVYEQQGKRRRAPCIPINAAQKWS